MGNRKRDREPGREQAAETRPLPPTRLARQLALAYLIEREIEAGQFKNYAEIAGRLRISRARVSQIAGMVMLPVAVQEAILRGEAAVSQAELRSLTRRIHSPVKARAPAK